MESEQENVCCKKRTYITSYTTFSNICLDRDILGACIKARCDIRADEFNFTMESFRKAAYRQYALWTCGKLGRGNRRVIPACVARMIRQTYPAPDGQSWNQHYLLKKTQNLVKASNELELLSQLLRFTFYFTKFVLLMKNKIHNNFEHFVSNR